MVSLRRRKHAVYIVLTAVTSIVSLVIVCTAFGTQDWIRARADPRISGGPLHSDINHGLFRGTLMRRPVYSPYAYDLYFTCIWAENSCAWSCAGNEDSRKEEIAQLVDGQTPIFSCVPRKNDAFFLTKPRISKESQEDRTFTNGALWLCTIIFMVIETIALLISAFLSIINTSSSPIQTFFNVQGIYISNAVAFCANFFVLMLYGICYDVYIKKDIAIYDTIVGDYDSDAGLGYSYWILLVPLIFEAIGVFLIVMREKIVNSDRAETKIDVATDVPETGVLF